MLVLPVPMIVALLLLALLIRAAIGRESHATLLALIGICALQSAIIALHQYYGVAWLRPVQPLGAMLIPPAAWIAFGYASGARTSIPALAPHALPPVAALLLLAIAPQWLDAAIPLSFAIYGGAMLWRLRKGEDSLPHARLESGNLPVVLWRVIALSLIASAASDVFISWSYARGNVQHAAWAASLVSSLSLLSLGVLSLSRAIESRRAPDDESMATPTQDDLARDRIIIGNLESFMESQKPFLDPDLTLTRLARRLIVPAKQLSAAINRIKGENVSRYINRHRIEHACRVMAQGHSVTEAMLQSGFNTKSNFNREFLRVMNASPSKWLEQQGRVL